MRVLATALAALILFASPGFAQSVRPDRPAAPSRQAVRPDFSASAAGIDRMAAAAAPRDARREARRPAPPQSSGGRSFWKSPWPYVIVGGVAAVVIIAAKNSENGLY